MKKLKLANDKSVGLEKWAVKSMGKDNGKWVHFATNFFDTKKEVDGFLRSETMTDYALRFYVYKVTYDFREGYQL